MQHAQQQAGAHVAGERAWWWVTGRDRPPVPHSDALSLSLRRKVGESLGAGSIEGGVRAGRRRQESRVQAQQACTWRHGRHDRKAGHAACMDREAYAMAC